MLRAFDDGRRDILERLRSARTPAGAQRLRALLAQLDVGAFAMRDRLREAVALTEANAHRRGLAHLLAIVRKAEPSFRDAAPTVEISVLRQLIEKQGLALHRFSVDRYGLQLIERAQRELVAGVAANQSVGSLSRRVSKALGTKRAQGALIVRMELSRAYNDAEEIGIREAAEEVPGLLKRIDEFRDHRNHPFSVAANGLTAKPGHLFRVPVAAVRAAAAQIGKPAALKAVLWEQRGGDFVGQNLPAHFNERGRIVPHHPSWRIG